MTEPSKPRIPIRPPAIPRPRTVDERLLTYLEEQERSDVKGAIDRLGDSFLQYAAKTEVAMTELKGDIRGVSLRVGALEKRSEKHETRIDSSQSWIIGDLEKKRDKAEGRIAWLRQNVFGIIASAVAGALGIYNLYRAITGK